MEQKEIDRVKRLRENVIKAMQDAVSEKPDEFDPDRLQQAIDAVNAVDDEQLDVYLIMNNPKSILLRQIRFTDEEVQRIRDVFTALHSEILKEVHDVGDDRSRDDYLWKLKTPTLPTYVVHVIKKHSEKPYVLSGCGIGGWTVLCDFEHETIDDLSKRVKCIMNEDIKYGVANAG